VNKKIEALERKIKDPLIFSSKGHTQITTLEKVDDLIFDALLKKKKFTVSPGRVQHKCAHCKNQTEYLWRPYGTGGLAFDKSNIFCKSCLPANSVLCLDVTSGDGVNTFYPAIADPMNGKFVMDSNLGIFPGFERKKWEEQIN
jgi:hypothetical protein